MFDLSGKLALVTGSSRGLGKGIALSLAQAGADVIVNYISSENEANEVVEQIKALGRKSVAIRADVSDPEQVRAMMSRIKADFGRLDILINNAGTSQSKDIFEIEPEDWDRIIKTNLTSGFLCSKYALELMREQRSGRVIFISSVVAERGALFGHVHYAATKAGQIGMAKTLARTVAQYNITVNCIAPGVHETELLYKTHGPEGIKRLGDDIPLGLGTTKDIGDAAVYLCSDEARYITGATLDVNGGTHFR